MLRLHTPSHLSNTLQTSTMAIYTLADLPTSRARSSSIPRQCHRIAEAERKEERFSVPKAVQLKLRLQALDQALSHEAGSAVDIDTTADACQSRLYVAGSEELYLAVKGLSRPDLIPDVYVEAYQTALQGRHYVNNYKVTDVRKGVDPTFSEIRAVLGDIDRVCETGLEGAFSRLEMKGRSISCRLVPPLTCPSQAVSIPPAACRAPPPYLFGPPTSQVSSSSSAAVLRPEVPQISAAKFGYLARQQTTPRRS
jgi:hypothetical protein